MNCQQIQEQLSQYLDNRLDDGKRREIEDHLAACSQCLPEAKLLSDGIKGVAGLPEVEPPAGFSTRVMTRIRSEKEAPARWTRLFQPLWIKIPLHATGVLLAFGLGVYLFSAHEPAQMEIARPAAAERPAQAKEGRSEAGASPDALGQQKGTAPEQGAPDIVLTLQPNGPAEKTSLLTAKMKQAAERSHGKLFALIKEPDPKNGNLHFWLHLPSSEYDRFKTEISPLGTPLSEFRPGAAAARSGIEDRSIQVRVTFLPENQNEIKPAAPPAPPQK